MCFGKGKGKGKAKGKGKGKAAPRKSPAPASKKRSRDDDDGDDGHFRNKQARTLGNHVRTNLSADDLPDMVEDEFYPGRPVNVMEGSKLKSDKQINGNYRRAWPAMDELFSTALTREFIKGFVDAAPMSKSDHNDLAKSIDLVSRLRMTTGFSGYATKEGVMQHPASAITQLFGDWKATAGEHSRMDTARRNYVETAMTEVMENGGTGQDVMIAGARAAIEFTLNYFTAPITASNVFDHSARAKLSLQARSQDVVEDLQLAERERLKRIYVELGGQLRDRDPSETSAQSRFRPWPESLTFDRESGSYPEAPPSPRRQVNLRPVLLKKYGVEPPV